MVMRIVCPLRLTGPATKAKNYCYFWKEEIKVLKIFGIVFKIWGFENVVIFFFSSDKNSGNKNIYKKDVEYRVLKSLKTRILRSIENKNLIKYSFEEQEKQPLVWNNSPSSLKNSSWVCGKPR